MLPGRGAGRFPPVFTLASERSVRAVDTAVVRDRHSADNAVGEFEGPFLSQILITFRESADVLSSHLEKLKALNDKNNLLKSEIRAELVKGESVQCMQKRLKAALSCLAHRVEGAIVSKLLRESRCPTADELGITSISHIEKSISGRGDYEGVFTKEQKEAVEHRWNDLKAELGWSGKHFRSIKHLKDFGTPEFAHKCFDMDAIQEAVTEESLEPEVAEMCQELIEIFKNLQ